MIHLLVDTAELRLLVSAIYAFNDEQGSAPLWNDIVARISSITLPWILIGNFNAVKIF